MDAVSKTFAAHLAFDCDWWSWRTFTRYHYLVANAPLRDPDIGRHLGLLP